jgi:hypothetical protein
MLGKQNISSSECGMSSISMELDFLKKSPQKLCIAKAILSGGVLKPQNFE